MAKPRTLPEPSLSGFVEAYEEYDGDDVGQLIHDWAQLLGCSA